MNRDTHTDVLDQATHNVNVTTCGQFRPPQDHHKELTTYAQTPEMDLQGCLKRGTDHKSFVLRSASSAVSPRTLSSNEDLRRNLYVLGLPPDLTKSEFAKIFEPYGTVTHAVILATLDSASRRRGFIVMSTHQEAKIAMDKLSRTQIKGHILDVSWAVVQRSQGFLDGADRTMMLAISAPASISERDGFSPITGVSQEHINPHWELAHTPTSKLVVSNLPIMLFTQVSDLHPLFLPFGPIKDIKILGSSHVGPPDTTITVMAEYVNVSNAQEAKEALQYQSYAGHPIEAHYICDASPSTHTRLSPFFSGSHLGHGKSSDIGLNPFAVPFNVGSRFSKGSQIYNSRYSTAIPSGLPSDAPLAPQPFPANIMMRPYMTTDAISRSSSTTSSTWSQDSRPLRPSRTSQSFQNCTNSYTSYA